MQVFTTYDNGRLTLYFQGELDHHECRNAMLLVDQTIDEFLPRSCVIDLSDLGFMDSSGVALILKIYRRMEEAKGRVWIENANNQPLKVIDASGIERLIKISVKQGGVV